ncbi:adenosylcobinamide-GDP ribazoletransferase [Dactylosporangium aurantiacum]|uniref:Adenosylcobinamide-GDP ribazoletransferase n=1 Tax=Dactylosporangium aurantiacum TaxID=35754 RepID=A0A9Q9IH62_9ACTN|nr:adenosylcobinamide-GDP ribazoletransferase [Dactylosporangium aurantiacum]MDG6102394.1 adenosylcobinamide-GDP ribazoletransferase [Dactylosporangium aurantiacum]UWZ53314.1 adenosylcobinamide-GDP ribazoletransferase [Dactylosporangium aurantiacum]
MGGLRLALTLFTVAPLGVSRVDRGTARTAMAVAPLVGLLLGAVLAAAALGLRAAGASALVAAAATVALSALCTRALHLDGLADTADGLGSYQGSEKALEIMKKSDIGPFGVVAIAAVLLLDASALTSVYSHPWPTALALVAAGAAAGRLGATIACRSGLPAARPDGLGALVAETLPRPIVMLITLLVAAAGAALAGPVRGPLAVLLAAGVAWALTLHARRRLGGVTGDVIGACVELATMTAWLVLSTTP